MHSLADVPKGQLQSRRGVAPDLPDANVRVVAVEALLVARPPKVDALVFRLQRGDVAACPEKAAG